MKFQWIRVFCCSNVCATVDLQAMTGVPGEEINKKSIRDKMLNAPKKNKKRLWKLLCVDEKKKHKKHKINHQWKMSRRCVKISINNILYMELYAIQYIIINAHAMCSIKGIMKTTRREKCERDKQNVVYVRCVCRHKRNRRITCSFLSPKTMNKKQQQAKIAKKRGRKSWRRRRRKSILKWEIERYAIVIGIVVACVCLCLCLWAINTTCISNVEWFSLFFCISCPANYKSFP